MTFKRYFIILDSKFTGNAFSVKWFIALWDSWPPRQGF